MCFAPQRRALFRHLNFQKCSEPDVFWHFAPQQRALFLTAQHPKVVWDPEFFALLTWRCASCHNGMCFSKSQLPKVLQRRGILSICASHHSGVQLFISHLTRWLRTCHFSEPTFRPSGATKHWKKHSVSRLFYLFAHLHLLSSDSFSSLISFFLFSSLTLPTSAFHLSILSEVWLLNFLRESL